jgi:hypothetical protein
VVVTKELVVVIMRKREMVGYFLLGILVVALASTSVYFFLDNGVLRSLLTQDQLRDMSEKAGNVYSRIESFTGWYDACMEKIRYDTRLVISNETKQHLVWRSWEYLDRYSDRASYDIEEDLGTLSYMDEKSSWGIYQNISDTIGYAIGQVDWAVLGRPSDEGLSLMWELYYLLGVDQITESENLTDLRAISRSFSLMSQYWYSEWTFTISQGRSPIPEYLPKPHVALEWAFGNATALYRKLAQWHERT